MSKRPNGKKPGRTRRDILEARILSAQELITFYEQSIEYQKSKIEKDNDELARLNEFPKED